MDRYVVLHDDREVLVLTTVVQRNEMIGNVGADLQTYTELPREEG
jgi:hypothetical protein